MLDILFSERKKRNFKNPNLKEVKTLEEAEREIRYRDYVKLIVHNYELRGDIRDSFMFTHVIETITQKGIEHNVDSTIAYHKTCKKATPFNELTEKDGNIICPHCRETANNELYLSTRHNVIVCKRIKYYVHNECGKRNNAKKLHWSRNTDHGECFDAYCLHCYEKMCFSCKDSDENMGYTVIF